jgi:hypothetical protein
MHQTVNWFNNFIHMVSFIPDEQTRILRSYVRLRKPNIRLASDHTTSGLESLGPYEYQTPFCHLSN